MLVTILGWIGMSLVLSSFIITGERNIRILNWGGSFFQALFFIFSGGVIKNLPIFIMNIILLMVNAYHIVRITNKKCRLKK